MKYKVVGWVDTAYNLTPCTITKNVFDAVVKEIREHGYLFGGDRHDECIPVLNDGTYADWSWRGWGGVMAEAHDFEPENPHRYMFGYMDMLLKNQVYPDTSLEYELFEFFVPRDEIADTHEFAVDADDFESIQSGVIPEHVTPSVAKIDRLDEGDYVRFYKDKDGESVTALVIWLYTNNALLSLPSALKQRDFIEAEIFGKHFSLEIFTDRLNDEAEKVLYKNEEEVLREYLKSGIYNEDEAKNLLNAYLVTNGFYKNGVQATADDVDFFAVHVAARKRGQSVIAFKGRCGDYLEELCFVFYNWECLGGCQPDEYTMIDYVRDINE